MLRVNNLVGFGTNRNSLQLAFVAAAVSSAANLTVPASAAIGDWAILFDFADAGSTPALVTPTGYTDLASAGASGAFGGGFNGRGAVSYKTLASGEPGAAITGMNGAGSNAKVMFVFRPSRALVSVTPNTWNGVLDPGDPAGQSVLAAAGTAPLIVFGCAATDAGTAAFSTASPAFDGTQLTGDSDMIAGYKIYNSGPADHSIDMNDVGRNYLASGFVAFT